MLVWFLGSGLRDIKENNASLSVSNNKPAIPANTQWEPGTLPSEQPLSWVISMRVCSSVSANPWILGSALRVPFISRKVGKDMTQDRLVPIIHSFVALNNSSHTCFHTLLHVGQLQMDMHSFLIRLEVYVGWEVEFGSNSVIQSLEIFFFDRFIFSSVGCCSTQLLYTTCEFVNMLDKFFSFSRSHFIRLTPAWLNHNLSLLELSYLLWPPHRRRKCTPLISIPQIQAHINIKYITLTGAPLRHTHSPTTNLSTYPWAKDHQFRLLHHQCHHHPELRLLLLTSASARSHGLASAPHL